MEVAGNGEATRSLKTRDKKLGRGRRWGSQVKLTARIMKDFQGYIYKGKCQENETKTGRGTSREKRSKEDAKILLLGTKNTAIQVLRGEWKGGPERPRRRDNT